MAPLKLCVPDVLQHSADRLGQAAQASSGVLLHHAGHPGWPHQDHPVQEPSCGRLLRVAAGCSHRNLPGRVCM